MRRTYRPRKMVLLNTVQYTTVGTQQATVPLQCRLIKAFVVGGGGGGDSGSANNPGNGGNGGQVRCFELKVSPGTNLTVTVGAGGLGGEGMGGLGRQGGSSIVSYNSVNYSAYGGYGGKNLSIGFNNTMEYSRLGGRGSFQETPGWLVYQYGVDGYENPFDLTDTNLYGASGTGGNNAYGGNPTQLSTAKTGGGQGGYGANNASTNTGGNASFYGAGGGGMAFSSDHVGRGGSGYRGIVIVYYYGYA